MRRNVLPWLLLITLLAGCQMLPGLGREAPTPTPSATARPIATTRPAAMASPTTLPTPMAQATTTATSAATVASATSAEVFKRALRPGARDVDVTGMTEYRLTLRIDEAVARLDGTAHIRYTNREQTELGEVFLHLFPNLWEAGMTVSQVKVDGQGAAATLERDGLLLRVPLPGALAKGKATELEIGFSVPIPSGTDIGNYGEFAWDKGVLALAGFYPTMVVHDERGWHLETPAPQGDVNFHDASLYDVTLTAPAELTVVATGDEIERKDSGDGMATWRIVGGPQRDFNITASAAFEQVSQTVGDVTVNSYFLPQHDEGGRMALKWAATALKLYDGEIGPYPYNELDVVETPTSAGGIEYPGMVVIAESLYGNRTRWDFFESATAHEVAHQWWYNVVGNDQVNEPWLDEALAQYSTYRYFTETYGAEGEQGFLESIRGRWERAGEEEKPIGLPVAAYQGSEYSAIVYGRGPLFFIALRDRIGEAKMEEFLRAYYTQFAWDIARPRALEATVERVSGQELSPLFDEWVYPRIARK